MRKEKVYYTGQGKSNIPEHCLDSAGIISKGMGGFLDSPEGTYIGSDHQNDPEVLTLVLFMKTIPEMGLHR